MALSDERFSADHILEMTDQEIGKHMSGGYGPGKFLAMARSIKALAVAVKHNGETPPEPRTAA